VGDDKRDDADLSWPRAAVLAGLTLVVGIAVVVVTTNLVVTQLTGIDRHLRVGLGCAWFVLSLTAMAWALRRLQARHVV
jgi:hypothetical protein